MKGFYIYEAESRIGTEVDCLKIGYIDHTFTHQINNSTLSEEVEMHALVSKGTKTKCNKEDTYDFEIGALIALMKMCGVDKVVRAFNEVFPKETYNTYITKYERELNELKKDFDKVKDLKEYYKKNYEDVKEHYDKLGDRNKYLIDDINKKLEYIKEKDEEIKKLKTDKDKTWKNYQRKIQKKQDRINDLEKAVSDAADALTELNDKYDKAMDGLKKAKELDEYREKHIKELEEEKEKLQHEYNLCLNSENALKYTVDSLNKSVDKLNKAIYGYKNDLYKAAERCKELSEENEKLKLDCEKLQHGYNDMIFCGGRQNGKQFTFLVELFKKLDQKKVDAAYKEAYQIKDFGEQINKLTVDSLIEQNRAFTKKCVDEWLYKILTKREEMWEKIFELHKESDVIIKVKKEDVITFLHEIENKIPEITWASDVKIFEAKYTIKDIFKEIEICDTPYEIYFRLWKVNKLSYSSDQHIYPYREIKSIDYLSPMRWDLFKKGRRIIRVNTDKLDEFMTKCSKELGGIMRPNLKRYKEFTHLFVMISDYHYDNKPTVHIMTPEDLVRNQHENPKKYSDKKIVNWEDVRDKSSTTEDPYDTWKW